MPADKKANTPLSWLYVFRNATLLFLKIISVLSSVTQHNYIFQIKTLIMGFHQLQSIKVRSANNSKSGRVCDVIF